MPQLKPRRILFVVPVVFFINREYHGAVSLTRDTVIGGGHGSGGRATGGRRVGGGGCGGGGGQS